MTSAIDLTITLPLSNLDVNVLATALPSRLEIVQRTKCLYNKHDPQGPVNIYGKETQQLYLSKSTDEQNCYVQS